MIIQRRSPTSVKAMVWKLYHRFGILLALAGLWGAGCDRSEPSIAPAKMKGTIGLSVLTMTNPFFKVIADSMAADAEKDPELK